MEQEFSQIYYTGCRRFLSSSLQKINFFLEEILFSKIYYATILPFSMQACKDFGYK